MKHNRCQYEADLWRVAIWSLFVILVLMLAYELGVQKGWIRW